MADRRVRACPTRRAALTLIDVVVAVASLAILAVFLLPAAAGVASVSKQSRCLDRLARIGYANLVYASEDPENSALPVHELFPTQSYGDPTFIGAYEWGGKSGSGTPGYAEGPTTGPYWWVSSKYGTRAGFGPSTRPLNRILYAQDFPDYLHPVFDQDGALSDTQLELDAYRCPSDFGYTGAHCPDFADRGLTSYDHFGTSYNANMFMTGSGARFDSNSPYLHRLSDIPNPATTLAYMENNGRWAWAVAPEQPDCTWIGQGVPGTVRGWHGKDWTFAAAFIDGHADMIHMRGYRNPHVMLDENDQDQSRCIIVRGDGWRKDTLPAELVPTNLVYGGGGRPSYEGCIETE